LVNIRAGNAPRQKYLGRRFVGSLLLGGYVADERGMIGYDCHLATICNHYVATKEDGIK
jgi:hypothetical protein